MTPQTPDKLSVILKEFDKLSVKSFNLKTNSYENAPIVFVNDRAEKIVKSFITTVYNQGLAEGREEILEKVEDEAANLDLSNKEYASFIEFLVSLKDNK
jgi:hypothetical protein